MLLLHDESLAEHGGAPDLADLAAAYAHGLAKNHPFIDGNKRAAFLAVGLFPALNGARLAASQADATARVFSLAGGELSEADFATWLRQNTVSRQPPPQLNEPRATYRT